MKKKLHTLVGISIFIFTVAGTAGATQITDSDWDIMRFKDTFLSEVTMIENGVRVNLNGLADDFNSLAALAQYHLGDNNLFAEYTGALTQMISRNPIDTLTATIGDYVEPSTSFQAFISTVTQNISTLGTDPAGIFTLLSGQFQQTIGSDQIIQSIQEMLNADTDSLLNSMDGQIFGNELIVQVNRNLYDSIAGMFHDGTAPKGPSPDLAPVPEPATLLLLGLGLGTLYIRRNKKRLIL